MRDVLDTKLYRYLETGSSFLFLSFVWLLACLPVLTLFPATVALFSVVRRWVEDREFDGAVKGFFYDFRREFRQGFLLGLAWISLGAIIVVNLFLVAQMPPLLQVPLYVFFVVAGFFYLASSVFLFPVAVNYDAGIRTTIKNSFLLSLSQFPTTLYGLIVLTVAASLVAILPATIFLTGGLTAYILYFLCNRAFLKVAAERRTPRS